jgi:hypothetical protein
LFKFTNKLNDIFCFALDPFKYYVPLGGGRGGGKGHSDYISKIDANSRIANTEKKILLLFCTKFVFSDHDKSQKRRQCPDKKFINNPM